ncbi:hypothetical protein OU415_02535 [Saccharopolyspora sp. WRP15-2]|uniref:XRE family transcriptional regulator n=1 Tax=Saccharopolyspora oryzae TaxID=2997343 RepID=A0ABT4URF1_9PSEU|nr:hypothetical protein [Saccharopolyspora oryzae]MDA3624295.1 hypothetical protein [Saccharopolyspora oryzae]
MARIKLDDAAADRLARAVRARREDLGWGPVEVERNGGPNRDRIWAIENKRQGAYDSKVLDALETGLWWERGSWRDIVYNKAERGVPQPGSETPSAAPRIEEGPHDTPSVGGPEPDSSEELGWYTMLLGACRALGAERFIELSARVAGEIRSQSIHPSRQQSDDDPPPTQPHNNTPLHDRGA